MRTPSEELIKMRKALASLKPRQCLKKYVDLKGRQTAYNAAKDIGIFIRALCTPETSGVDDGKKLFEVERIR